MRLKPAMTVKRSLMRVLMSVPAALWPCRLLAADALPPEGKLISSGGQGETVALLMAIVKVAGSLIVVVGLMLLAVHLIKKIGLGRGSGGDGRMIDVLDTRMIAPKKYVAVVRIAGKCVALGITDQQINLLTRVEDSHPRQEDVQPGGASAGGDPGFAAVLKRAAGLGRKKENAKTAGE